MSARRLLLALACLAGLAGSTVSALADGPAADRGVTAVPSNTPTDDEQQLLGALRDTRMPPGHVEGRVYIPDQKSHVLIQPQGRIWRDFHVSYARWMHAGLIILAAGLMLLLFLVRGGQTYERDPQGRRIRRFRVIDRLVHWMVAVSFVTLAFTGLNLLFGRPLIEGWLGDQAFSTLTHYGKLTHNYIGYAFLLGILAMAVMWLQDNIPSKVDVLWLKKGGGLLSGEHVPAEKFNAGQKMIYWIALFGGGAISVTGILLMFPFYFTGIEGMQIINVIHTVIAALMIAVIIGHIYLGSVGVSGSFDAMAKGTVDLNWAKTHHPIWVETLEQKGRLQVLDDTGARPARAP